LLRSVYAILRTGSTFIINKTPGFSQSLIKRGVRMSPEVHFSLSALLATVKANLTFRVTCIVIYSYNKTVHRDIFL